MYRTNAQSRAIEEALIRAGVPYQLVGATRFYERREVKDCIAYLRLVHNPFDTVSLGRVINVPARGVGEKTTEQLERWAGELGVPVYTALQVLAGQQRGTDAEALRFRPHPFAGRQATALGGFLEMIDELIDVAAKNSVSTLLDGMLERVQYRRYLYDTYEETEAEERWDNVQQLRALAAEYDGLAPGEGLTALLEGVALVSDQDTLRDIEGSGAVTLITLHSAKGLEFPVVFMIALEEGILPHIRSFDDPAQMEEERRLCYVGMTRAKERLYMLRAFKRYGNGRPGHGPPSRFLLDLPPEVIAPKSRIRGEEIQREPARYAAAIARPADTRPLAPDGPAFSGGERVRHPRFGEGIVVGCVEKGDDQEITVAFKGEAGIKKLMLSFAPLERV
jgi:DNA helicase-2/ATP-dependent DNA helicase PcrA